MTVATPAELRAELEEAVEIGTEIVDRTRRDPIASIRWLPLQWAFLADPFPFKCIRAGNQTIGKTTASFALTIGYCLGRHPLGAAGYDMPPTPVDWWLVLQSFGTVDQQRKLLELLPPDELDPRTEFDKVRGFRPVNAPAILFKNGSILRLKTGNQDALDFAGATLDGITWDEPPRSSRMFTESLQRVEERGGVVLLSFTPINARVEYLRELCESGAVHDHWTPLTPEQLVPVGALEPIRTRDGRAKDGRWIEERIRLCPSHEVPVVVHGEWETRSVDRYFSQFRDGGGDAHVHARVPEEEVDLALGIDHGSRPGKQIAVLMAVWRDRPDRPWRVYVVDEYTDPTGQATHADDARGILAMLGRHSVRWRDLSFAGGDRVHEQGTPNQKSNRDLMGALRRELVRMDQLDPGAEISPQVRTIKRGTGRGHGSVGVRSKWLYHRTCEAGGFGLHPRCKRVIAALSRYDLRDNEWKDPIDAVVYGLDPWIYGSGPIRGEPVDVRLG